MTVVTPTTRQQDAAPAVTGPCCASALPLDLDLTPVARNPLRLSDAALRAAQATPFPAPPTAAPAQPRFSVIVPTHRNLALCRLCLASVLRHSGDAFELIVVDDASTDGTAAMLAELAAGPARDPRVRVLTQPRNLGFAAAVNRGLATARGSILVLLNDDTLVAPGWLDGLARHLSDPALGAVGPVTNRIGNEAEVESDYRTVRDFLAFSGARAKTHADARTEPQTLILFCAAFHRDTIDRVGPLDERFEVGMFEDDDYTRRLRAAGLGVACAEDVFIHHFGQATLGHLVPTGRFGEVFEANRRRFEAKWGVTWEPHPRRERPAYDAAVALLRDEALAAIPAGATVAVVSKGDDRLLDLPGRSAWHFPRLADGRYAGSYPADGPAAVEQLEAVRRAGAGYLLLPHAAAWWLDHYTGLREHLAAGETRLGRACNIYRLASNRGGKP